MKRTDAQKRAFALECLEIERAGGDVLGHIEVNWPSYTPRATWYRLQRAWLGRQAHQLTEGKPKEKGETQMGKMMDLARGCLEAYGRGEKVFDYLASQGIKNPSAYWYQTKATVKTRDPELYERLCVISTDSRKKEPKKVTFDGKEFEKYNAPETVVEMKDKHGNTERVKLYGASPACCQPAPPSGVTVPDVLPEELKPLMIAALLYSIDPHYKYELIKTRDMDGIHMALCWRDRLCNQDHNLIFTPAEWRKLSKEILTALEQFGI